MDPVTLIGIVSASVLGLVLAIYGVFFNGRATRALIRQIHQDTQDHMARMHQETQDQTARMHADTLSLLTSIQSETQAIHATTQAIQSTAQAIHAHLADMDRRHTEILSEIARKG
jgi:cell division septum initiation protein DivIVA